MPWLEVHVTTDRNQAPLAERLLEDYGAVSVTFADAADDPVYEPPPGTTPLWTMTRVTGLFPIEQDADRLRNDLHRELMPYNPSIDVAVLADRAWEHLWLQRFSAMRFGRRLWVCPTNEIVSQPDAVVVKLNPGLAFGTGTHPTTALCLRWLDHTPLKGKSLVDFGCGSGILSIAAARLGAAHVTALDHDPQAVAATRDNLAFNGLADRTEVHLSDGHTIPRGDLVVANVLTNVLIEQSTQLIAATRVGGKIAMSGILRSQIDTIRACFDHVIEFECPWLQEDWALLNGTRRH